VSYHISASGSAAEVMAQLSLGASQSQSLASDDERSAFHAALAAAFAAVKACHPSASVGVTLFGSESSRDLAEIGPLRVQSVNLSFSASLPG
jgi:hypothetical protein